MQGFGVKETLAPQRAGKIATLDEAGQKGGISSPMDGSFALLLFEPIDAFQWDCIEKVRRMG